jgi:hypothetical protein
MKSVKYNINEHIQTSKILSRREITSISIVILDRALYLNIMYNLMPVIYNEIREI